MKELLKKLGEYLKYPSTYKGIVALLGVIGVNVMPEQAEAIATLGVAIYGALSVFLSDADVKAKK